MKGRSTMRVAQGLLLIVALGLIHEKAEAIQLTWAGGATARNFSEATRCTLEVRASGSEEALPHDWRLVWATQNCYIDPIESDTLSLDPVGVCTYRMPGTTEERANNLANAKFCTGGSPSEAVRFILDLPEDGSGKLQVVALDPDDPDSTRVISSSIVTFNGGVDRPLPPVILRASKSHESLTYSVSVVGWGLDTDGSTVSIQAPELQWIQDLAVMEQADSALVAEARFAALVPAHLLTVQGGQSSGLAVQALPEDEPMSVTSGCVSVFHEPYLSDLDFDPIPLPYVIQPKDFSIVRGFVDQVENKYAIHLFYTRQNEILRLNEQPDIADRSLGHSILTDWNTTGWSDPDTVAFSARTGTSYFDNGRVWAPHIFLRGLTYYMFYTGIHSNGDQYIGLARSQDLETWDRESDRVFSATMVPWADKATPAAYGGRLQCRDPFVIRDEANNRWLMYYSTLDSLDELDENDQNIVKSVIGVAVSNGNFTTWTDLAALRKTEANTVELGTTRLVESPHILSRDAEFWLMYSVNGTYVHFETTADDMADPAPGNWSSPTFFRSVVQGSALEQEYWHATEYFTVNHFENLAAFNDQNQSIEVQQIYPLSSSHAPEERLALGCPQVAGVANIVGPGQVRLIVPPGVVRDGQIDMRVVIPSDTHVKLGVYDISGRLRRTLLEKVLPSGVSSVSWDLRDQNGVRLTSGVYFVGVRTPSGRDGGKIVVIR